MSYRHLLFLLIFHLKSGMCYRVLRFSSYYCSWFNFKCSRTSLSFKYKLHHILSWLYLFMCYIMVFFIFLKDTLVAMEALNAFTLIDPNRNVFNMQLQLESSATHGWMQYLYLLKNNYTNTEQKSVSIMLYIVGGFFFLICWL